MVLDNIVAWEVPSMTYPLPWRVVRLKRVVPGLFRNDTVEYLRSKWRVYEIQELGEVLVLRPE